MSEQEKDWKKLTIANHFIFSKVMRDTKICKEVLCRLLPDMDIRDIKIVEYEKSYGRKFGNEGSTIGYLFE